MLNQIHPNIIRQLLFIAILIILAIVIGREMYFLLGAFLGAITLYVLMRGTLYKLIIQYKMKKWLAALILIIGSLIAIVLPSIWVVSIAINKLTPIINNPSIVTSSFQTIHDYLLTKFNLDILNKENISKINAQLLPAVQKTIGSTLASLGNLFVMYFILFFLLTGSVEIEKWLRNHVPFKNNNVIKVIGEFRSLVYSNAVGIPIVAVLQGITGLIGYWIFGVDEFLLMGLFTAICSVLPVVGAMIIYVPLGIYEIAIGHTWQGIAVIIWGFALIGTIDNVARFMIQKRIADVHPMITIFGVIIGINMFGFLGIIFGPLLLSMFILLVKIYDDEFGKSSPDQNVVSAES